MRRSTCGLCVPFQRKSASGCPGAAGTLAFCLALACGMASPAGASAADRIVVANRASGTVSIIDAASDQVVETLALPPADLPSEPMYVVYTPADHRMWVGERANSRVVVFDAHDFSVAGTVAVGNGVFHMATDRAGSQVWVVTDTDRAADVIDAKTMEVVATVPMPEDLTAAGAIPHDVVLDPQGTTAYVTLLGVPGPSDALVAFDTATLEEVDRAETGEAPHAAFVHQQDSLYVTCQGSNQLLLLDASTLDLLDALDVPGTHGAVVSRDGRRFYTTNISGGGVMALFAIDTKDNSFVGAPADTPDTMPHNLAVARNGKKLYVTHSGPNDTVSVFDVSGEGRPAFLTTIVVESNPFGIVTIP